MKGVVEPREAIEARAERNSRDRQSRARQQTTRKQESRSAHHLQRSAAPLLLHHPPQMPGRGAQAAGGRLEALSEQPVPLNVLDELPSLSRDNCPAPKVRVPGGTAGKAESPLLRQPRPF